ncbi:hypothetical protein SDC49_02660 [Lactobacillus sp. R2/2]|nr:hypothetical protein [Lactobacillus sp. R2/2]
MLGGVAAAALGLINAKPQTVKAANQNGNRATKKTASRAVKTKLTYQSETDSETEGETATNDDPTGQNSSSQTAGSENSVGTASSNPETGQGQAGANSNPASSSNQNAAAGNTSAPSTTDNAKADKQETGSTQFDPAKATRDGAISGTWNSIPTTFSDGVLSIGEPGNNYSIGNKNYDYQGLSFSDNKKNLKIDDLSTITEVDFNAPIKVLGGVINFLVV